MGYNKIANIAGWIVFAIAAVVFAMTAEPTGSLWDCGEFITGATKLEVVHPPGAPIFIVIGRMFTLVAELISNNPEDISYAVNLMSGLCTATAAMMVCWITIMFGKLSLVGREGETNSGMNIALAGSGVVAGLSTAFCTSIWFSAVEGEVYAMSTMFTTLVVWGMTKWYSLPDTKEADRWIIFSLFMAGMSIGVHLLSLLTIPAMALLYYFKKYKNHNFLGFILAGLAGVMTMVFIQYFIIVGIATIWTKLEMMMVNSFGMPQHSGLIPLAALLIGSVWLGNTYAKKLRMRELQYAVMAFALIMIAYTSIGIVVIRADVSTPINMNEPSNAMRLLPYLNREQYGERPLVNGPAFNVSPNGSNDEARYDYVEETGKYEATDNKLSYEWPKNSGMFFPRLGHSDRDQLYMEWLGLDYRRDAQNQPIKDQKGQPVLERKLTFGDNLNFFFNYQIRWMYVRYFMWNFSGKQNGQQGFYSWDAAKGHWITGIDALDRSKIGNTSALTTSMKEDQSNNKYYMIPFLFGLLGMFYLFRKRPKDALALLALFFMTGLAIIIYSNQPPNEPRERDYVLVGSFFTYCIFIGMGVLALFDMAMKSIEMDEKVKAGIATAIIMIAPILMLTQNYDDHSRAKHYGARDYASNFLNTVDKDAIIFTYGDNDTYPLWYAQEIEGIRTDVRVVNLSLIQVDWYIKQLRRKVNDSEAIKFSVPQSQIRGKKRNQFLDKTVLSGRRDIREVVKYMGDDHPVTLASGDRMESHTPTRQLYIDIDSTKFADNNWVKESRKKDIRKRITFNIPKSKRSLMKGDLAMLDIVASNINDRPIYYAVTVRDENLLGLQKYLQLEGLALRLVPVSEDPNPSLRGLGVLGYGSVDGDKMHENVTKNWRWGNFDKYDMYVDDKYGPSVQSMHYAMRRGAKDLVSSGKKQKAEDMIDTYFKAFPNFNFAYDYDIVPFLEMYADIGKYEKAKPYIDQLITNVKEDMAYYDSQPEHLIRASRTIGNIRGMSNNSAILLRDLATKQNDQALLDRIKNELMPLGLLQQQQRQAPPPPQPPARPEGSS